MAASFIRFDVLSLFPDLLDGFLSESILGRSIERGQVEVHRWNIRDWAEGRHKQVDDTPYGGGPGMVLMAPPVVSAVEAVRAVDERPGRLIVLTPRGRRFDQAYVRELVPGASNRAALRPLRGLRRACPGGSAAGAAVDRRLRSLRGRGARRWWSSRPSSG